MKSDRLNFIQKLGLGTAGLGISGAANARSLEHKEMEDEQILFVGDNIAVANTHYGKVKGYILKGIPL